MNELREQSGPVKTIIVIVGLPSDLVSLWRHLTRQRRRQFEMLLGLMLISAFAEVVSLGAVLPFLGILVTPDKVFNHPIVADVSAGKAQWGSWPVGVHLGKTVTGN